jgi:hypothetical protein
MFFEFLQQIIRRKQKGMLKKEDIKLPATVETGYSGWGNETLKKLQ